MHNMTDASPPLGVPYVFVFTSLLIGRSGLWISVWSFGKQNGHYSLTKQVILLSI